MSDSKNSVPPPHTYIIRVRVTDKAYTESLALSVGEFSLEVFCYLCREQLMSENQMHFPVSLYTIPPSKLTFQYQPSGQFCTMMTSFRLEA